MESSTQVTSPSESGLGQTPSPLIQALDYLGRSFIQEKWVLIRGFHDNAYDGVVAYLQDQSIDYRELNNPSPTELLGLASPYLAFSDKQTIQFNNVDGLNHISKALILGKTQSPAEAFQNEHLSFFEFYKQLVNAAWLKDCLLPVKHHLIWVFLASILIHLLGLSTAIFSIQVYDRIIPNKAIESLWALATGVGICLIADFYLKKARHGVIEASSAIADRLCAQRLANTLFAKRNQALNHASYQQHLRSFDQLRELITGTFLLSLVDLPFSLLFVGVLGFLHPTLMLVSLVIITLGFVVVIIQHKTLTKAGGALYQSQKSSQTTWLDSIGLIPVYQAHGASLPATRRLDASQAELRYTGLESRDAIFRSTLINGVIQQGGWVLVILCGVYLTLNNDLTVGGMIAASILSMRAFAPVSKLQATLTQFQSSQKGFQSLNDLLSRQEKQSHTQALEHIQNLSVVNVSHIAPTTAQVPQATQQQKRILGKISLDIKAGERVCLVGPVGSGKTTLLSILANVVTPSDGQVKVNHIDRSLLDSASLGRQTAFLPSHLHFFEGTLLENLNLGRPWVSTEMINQAIKRVGLGTWVSSHEMGLQMPIASAGANLSTGQKRLLAICRAMAGNPSLVLLDEPTSSLDHPGKRALLDWLTQLPKHTTVIIATHDRALLEWATRVVLLSEGQVRFDGNPDEFLRSLSNRTEAQQ